MAHHVSDRATADAATSLISRFGDAAKQEAAARAAASRNLGNVQHFCRWRQVERMVGLLSGDRAMGTIH